MAYQFAHIATHSVKGSGGSRSVRDVLSEAARNIEHCPHVKSPQTPTLLFGMSPEELLIYHDALVADTKKQIRADNKNKQKPERLKNIRQDTHTLSSWVMSYPTPVTEMNQIEKALFKQWAHDTLKVVQQDAESRGLTLHTGVIHLDESHPHIHFYALNESDERLDSKKAHPGHAAAQKAVINNQRPTESYRKAMTEWQDRIWLATGAKYGHARLGPRKRRLTRGQWREEQVAAKNVTNALQKVAAMEQSARSELAEAKAIKAKAENALDRLNSLIGRTIRLCMKWAKLWKLVPHPITAEIQGISEALSQLDLLPETTELRTALAESAATPTLDRNFNTHSTQKPTSKM